PFLQTWLGSCSVVPRLVGDAAPHQAADVLALLWGGPETLIVVSSDLSHFHDYETAQRLDGRTAGLIERGDWAGLGPDEACGHVAVAGLLIEAENRALVPHPLALRNSRGTAGPPGRGGGAGAWAFAQ